MFFYLSLIFAYFSDIWFNDFKLWNCNFNLLVLRLIQLSLMLLPLKLSLFLSFLVIFLFLPFTLYSSFIRNVFYSQRFCLFYSFPFVFYDLWHDDILLNLFIICFIFFNFNSYICTFNRFLLTNRFLLLLISDWIFSLRLSIDMAVSNRTLIFFINNFIILFTIWAIIISWLESGCM